MAGSIGGISTSRPVSSTICAEIIAPPGTIENRDIAAEKIVNSERGSLLKLSKPFIMIVTILVTGSDFDE